MVNIRIPKDHGTGVGRSGMELEGLKSSRLRGSSSHHMLKHSRSTGC